MVVPVIYFSVQPVIHDCCSKGRGMCYPVYGMMLIKEPSLLIGKIAHVAATDFLFRYQSGPLPLLCLTPYNHKQNMLSASLNKTFHSFLVRFLLEFSIQICIFYVFPLKKCWNLGERLRIIGALTNHLS